MKTTLSQQVQRYCEQCGAALTKSVEKAGGFNPDNGEPWYFGILTCPNKTKPKHFWNRDWHTRAMLEDKWAFADNRSAYRFTLDELKEVGFPGPALETKS